MTVLLVALGAALGAPLRYLLDRAVQTRHDSVFPWGTLLVNVTGCLILGALTGAAVSSPVFALAGTGFCGALTTYSTFGYETIRLLEERDHRDAALNVAISVLAGLGATALAYIATHALLG
ncbi:fluoride efflux transporter CrcB [Nocardia sp. CDC159]|uniref:Fluoride-specific ion channel FluC n=1 Tax=Nocardia pulmonis TaxID=2951408 RepID=A0A9X2EA30_9NOCA|nr:MULTISPECIES: fluoride efflux transporter CrcB [Nocardia]MCM6776481.1 fluoride efflux transporter CrcB [Nocardia pulmonis]MCM6788905.1 fluoride efflux transporter CrcB [Nocardia sp. CDC159]